MAALVREGEMHHCLDTGGHTFAGSHKTKSQSIMSSNPSRSNCIHIRQYTVFYTAEHVA